MAVVLTNPEVSKWTSERKRSLRLTRTIKMRTGVEPKPDVLAQEPAKLEYPYDDLYLMYDYLIKEMGIKSPLK
ncbi:MAG: hypothetical protein ABSC17_10375 [Thermacetogeniaceae bacterium]